MREKRKEMALARRCRERRAKKGGSWARVLVVPVLFIATATVGLSSMRYRSERVGAFIEYYAAFTDEGIDDEHAMDGGFTWLVSDDLQLDLSVGAGLNHAAPDFFVSVGAAWRFFLP